ncbi:MAG TPA: signal peptide peptidase SppA [Candidatus Altiarchaeales archaeon]|nr:signal peptide peptidase SppA [Candidatus Altiarchaeales archaeon]
MNMKTKWKVIITIGAFVLFIIGTIGIVFFFAAIVSSDFSPIGNKISVIPIKGEITMEGCSGGLFGIPQCTNVKRLKDIIKREDNDPMVKAIVLDINSGGGSVVASRELMQAVKNCKKPVVAWIGETGASGAYYVASGSDEIIADENSITGSIGVIMTIQHYYELYSKIGINVTVIKSGKVKDIGSPYREMTQEEKDELKGIVDKVYDSFISDVAENRNLPVEYVRNISDGSIYLGGDAKDLGLVDDVGGIDKAIEVAKELSGIEGEARVEVVEEERPLTLWDLLSG